VPTALSVRRSVVDRDLACVEERVSVRTGSVPVDCGDDELVGATIVFTLKILVAMSSLLVKGSSPRKT